MPPLLPHRIRIVIIRLTSFSDASAKASTKALVSAEAPSRSIRTMIWILTTRDRGSWNIPLLLIPPLLTLIPLTPILLTPPPMTLPLIGCHGSHWEAAKMPFEKWDDAGADGNVDGWRRIFVSLICRLRWEIKVSLIIILLQPLGIKYPSLDLHSKQVTLPPCQLTLISPTVYWNV